MLFHPMTLNDNTIESLFSQLKTLQNPDTVMIQSKSATFKPRRVPSKSSRSTQIDLSITGPKPNALSIKQESTDNSAGPTKIQLKKCRPRQNVKKIEPQLDEVFRPKVWANQVFGYEKDETTGKFQCQLCDFSSKTSNGIGMHMPLHFPPRKDLCCTYCGDCYHIKTAYTQHFLVQCSWCGEEVRESSWSAHKKKHLNDKKKHLNDKSLG